jgi:hypothetical protein
MRSLFFVALVTSLGCSSTQAAQDGGNDATVSTDASDAASDTSPLADAEPEAGDASDTAAPTIIFGMYDNTAIAPGAETPTAANFRAIANKWMDGSRINVHRVFDDETSFPANYAASAGGQDPASGNVSFLSVKPPNDDHAGVAAGTYNAQITTLAASIPAGSYFTMWHEPENDMSATDFVAMFQKFYTVAKAANANITIGYIAMAYQWGMGMASTASEDPWYPGDAYTDFLAVDAYDPGYSGQHSLDTEADFQRWFTWAQKWNKPLLITEYGVENASSTNGFTDTVRATIIAKSIAYAAGYPSIKMMLYWNGTDATPGGTNWFLNPTTSFPTDSYAQARAAWNAGVATYGTTGTSY